MPEKNEKKDEREKTAVLLLASDLSVYIIA
jgi:hypothetical protein